MGDQIRIPRVVVTFSSFFSFLLQGNILGLQNCHTCVMSFLLFINFLFLTSPWPYLCVFITLLVVCFSLEISAGIMRRDHPKGEWHETWARHAREEKRSADSSRVFEDIHTCQNNLIN